MKKILLSILLVICTVIGFTQTYPTPYQNLGSPAVGVRNPGGMFVNGMFQGPTFLDTAHANSSGYAANYPGSLIFTTSDDNLWKRNSILTRWDLVGSGAGLDTVYTKAPIAVYTDSTGHQVIYFLQNGLISGGIITQAACLQIGVTAANYGINYKSYTSAATILTVSAADPSNPRTDAVVADTLGNVSIIVGTPSATPLAPAINPSSQVLLGTYTILAGASCLGLLHETIYDENLGATSEWNTSSSGTISTNFNNTANPYHLTKADFTTTYANTSQLIFTKGSNDTAQISEVLNFFVYLNIALGGNQLQISFYNGSTQVGNTVAFNVGYGLNPNNTTAYQNVSIPFSAFNLTSQVFTKMVIQFAGNDLSGAGGIYIDYIQLQTGGTQTNSQLTVTTNGISGPATYNSQTQILNIPIYGAAGNQTITWSVLDSLSTPNPAAVIGDIYLVGTSPTGLFVGHANNIAVYTAAGQYTFDTVTVIGTLLYNATSNMVSKWTGTSWLQIGSPIPTGAGLYQRLAVWSSNTSIKASNIFNDSTNTGIGTPTPGGELEVRANDSATNYAVNVMVLNHRSSKTTSAGFGEAFLYELQDSTVYDRQVYQQIVAMVNASDASRRASANDYMLNNVGSNKIAISRILQADQSTVNVGVGTALPDSVLTVVGGVKFNTGRASAGYVLTAIDNNGGADWRANSGGGGGGIGQVVAVNGLNNPNDSTVSLGGNLTGNTTINTTSAYYLDIIGGNTSNPTLSVTGADNNGGALSVYNSSTNANAAAISLDNPETVIHATADKPDSTTTEDVLEVNRTAAVGKVGFGVRSFVYMTNANNSNSPNAFDWTTTWTNATAGSETSDYAIHLSNLGTYYRRLYLAGSGALTLDGYASRALYHNDTTNYKPLIIDNSGNVFQGSWAGSGGGGSTLTRQVQNSGTSVTVQGGNYVLTIDPSSTLSVDTVKMPASPSDLQTVEVGFGGTLTSGMVVTSLVVLGNSGQTIQDNTPPGSATADNTLYYRYYTSKTAWQRIKL